jgi:hypothetical protein
VNTPNPRLVEAAAARDRRQYDGYREAMTAVWGGRVSAARLFHVLCEAIESDAIRPQPGVDLGEQFRLQAELHRAQEAAVAAAVRPEDLHVRVEYQFPGDVDSKTPPYAEVAYLPLALVEAFGLAHAFLTWNVPDGENRDPSWITWFQTDGPFYDADANELEDPAGAEEESLHAQGPDAAGPAPAGRAYDIDEVPGDLAR